MLERDRRRAQTRRHAEQVLRRAWLAENDKWAACPNHGRSATLDGNDFWCGTTNLYFLPSHDDGRTTPSLLICVEPTCESTWNTITSRTHP